MSAPRPQQHTGIKQIAIVGVGLIGGSIAAALRKRGFAGRIVGWGRSAERLDSTRRAGLIDSVATSLADAASASDFIVVCTPVDLIVRSVREAAEHARTGTLITDAGSVKRSICRELAEGLPAAARFIGSHPMAGSEQRGFEHADPDLFVGRITVVAPLENARPVDLTRLKSFWSSLGSAVVELSPEEHDRAVAEISHVPHVAAAALAATLSHENHKLAATGFRDTTRVASGDPALWSPILLSNVDEVIRSLDAYARALAGFRHALASRDAGALKKLLQDAKSKRDALG